MLNTHEVIRAWNTSEFRIILKNELEKLEAAALPLQCALKTSSAVAQKPISILPLSDRQEDNVIFAKVGVLFNGIIAGCQCADDPTPDELFNEYCELWVKINTTTYDVSYQIILDS